MGGLVGRRSVLYGIPLARSAVPPTPFLRLVLYPLVIDLHPAKNSTEVRA